MRNKTSFSAFCSSIGTPLYNVRWSWSARSPGLGRSVFTVWADQLINGRYEIWNPSEAAKPKHGARTEICKIFEAAMQANDLAFGILCYPVDRAATPRKRLGYDEDRLLILELVEEEGSLVAYVTGEVRPGSLTTGTLGAVTPVSWAVDDLLAPPPGDDDPERRTFQTSGYLRDDHVRRYVIRRSNGKCEFCGRIDFLKPDGSGYVETHHIISLAQHGPDTVENVIALCAGHHREAHYGANRHRLERGFLQKLAALNSHVVASR
jgi:HNH endonuclease